MENLSLEQKIHQMFILGYEEENPLADSYFMQALKSGLGGVIFFTRNIVERENFKNAVQIIKDNAIPACPIFLSIDQEGGRVERTLTLYGGTHYKSAREAAGLGVHFVKQQSEWIAQELKYFGLNMNFAPVLDVDTNPDNPVIAERAYSSNPDEVIKFGNIALETYMKNKIVPVAKHFPGHGDTKTDSHVDLPELDMSLEQLENLHIKPFKQLVDKIPVLMVAHVHYRAFDSKKIPASISKNVINYLRNTLNYKGLIVSDDMVMGGIRRFTPFEACKKAIDAGINMFIYRNANQAVAELIEQIVDAVKLGKISEQKIDESIRYIAEVKKSL